jgi:gliding motility-associated-like protein
MKQRIVFYITLLISGLTVVGQDHQSFNNYTGDWEQPATWETGDGIVLNGESVTIYGFITRNGSLNFDVAINIDIYDTLIVTGDLEFSIISTLNVRPGGLLIVLGDLIGLLSYANNDGDIIVAGEFGMYGAIFDTEDGNTYLFDDTPFAIPEAMGTLQDEADIPPGLLDFFSYHQCINSDIENPVIFLPSVADLQCFGDIPGVFANYAALVSAGGSVTDNCDINTTAFMHVSDISDGNSCPEIITRTYSIVDVAGNTGTATQTITIDDTTDPELTLPAIAGVQCASGIPAVYADYAALTAAGGSASDNCGVDLSAFAHVSDISDGNTCPEVITRTYSIADDCGNTGTATQTITIEDITDPELTLPVMAGVQCASGIPAVYADYAALTAAGGSASDNCGVDLSAFTHVSDISDGNTCPEVITRTYSIADNCGNTGTATQTITIDDTTDPELTLPAIAGVQCASGIPAVYADYAALTAAGGSASDNCDIDLSAFTHVSDVSDGNTCPEVITRTYSIADHCGNTGTATQTITIDDTTDPELMLPAMAGVQCASGIPAVYADYAALTAAGGSASDNCGIEESTLMLLSETSIPSGSDIMVTRFYQISDFCGNSAIASHSITIQDNTPPILTCRDDMEFCAQDPSGLTIVGISPVVVSDNCSMPGDISLSYTISGSTNTSGTGDASGEFFNNGSSALTYTATDENGNSRVCITNITVNTLPLTSPISGKTTPACEETDVIYSVSGNPASKYTWAIPADAILKTDTSNIGTDAITVDFGTVSGTITVQESSAAGCKGELVELDIELQGCTLIPEFTTDKTEFCLGDTVTVQSVSIGVSGSSTFSWNFDDDASPATAIGSGPHKIVYNSAGTKTITLAVTEGITSSVSHEVGVFAAPEISLATEDRCGSGQVLFSATTSDGIQVDFSVDGGMNIVSSDNSFPFEYTPYLEESESVQVWARSVSASPGCKSLWSAGLTAMSSPMPQTGEISGGTGGTTEYLDIVCAEETKVYAVSGEGGSDFSWMIPALGINQTGATNTISVNWDLAAGDYVISVQEIPLTGCAGTVREELVQVTRPHVELAESPEICEGESYTFEAGEGYASYLWHDNSVLSTYSGIRNEMVSVEVTDEFGCKGYDEAQLIVHANPVLYLGNDTILCGEETYEIITDDGFAHYNWSNGDNTNSTILHAGDGRITLTVTDGNSCTSTDEISVLVCDPSVLFNSIPNAFTPNGDGVHETWVITHIDSYPKAEITVYDRTGRIVFYVKGGYDNSWKGDYDGKPLPMDTYYFIIDFHSSEIQPRKGTVTIVLD